MPNIDSSKVTTGKPAIAGSIFTAPAGTALAANDAVTALPEVFKSVGYISEDGVTNEASISSEDIKDWSGAIVLSPQTEKTDTVKFKMIESLNMEAMKIMFGDSNVSQGSDGTITILANAKEMPKRALVIEMLLTNGMAKRIYLPTCKVTETSEIQYAAGEAVGYEVTITAFPDSNGNTHYEYIQTEE